MSNDSSPGVAPQRSVSIVWFVGLVALAWGLSGCLRAGVGSLGTVDGQGVDASADVGGGDGAAMDAGAADGATADSGTGDDGGALDVSPQDGPPGCQGPADCDDDDPCTEDGCDPTTGQCVHKAAPGCGGPCVSADGVPLDCDDGDPCTEDACVPSAGGCVYTPIPGCGVVCPSTAECQDDAGCGDKDPCTKDLCVSCACQHVQRTGCGPTCDGLICDDGDPCTVDACYEGQCFSEPIPGCGVTPTPSCSSQGVGAIADALWAPPGDAAKIAGTPQPGPPMGCTMMACTPEDPCCNQCSAALRLADPAGTSMEAQTMLDSEASWACETDDCGAPLGCAPPLLGTAYWAWGTLLPGQGYPLPAGVAAMPSNVLGVEGWCIQTNEAGLPGHYEGTLELTDPATGNSTSVSMTMDISLTASGWHIQVAPTDATVEPVAPQEALGVVIGDGFIELSLDVATPNGMTFSQPVHLDSWHNHLQGPVGGFGASPPIPLPAPWGTADFQKIPGGL